jgi:hypothetical protein
MDLGRWGGECYALAPKEHGEGKVENSKEVYRKENE